MLMPDPSLQIKSTVACGEIDDILGFKTFPIQLDDSCDPRNLAEHETL